MILVCIESEGGEQDTICCYTHKLHIPFPFFRTSNIRRFTPEAKVHYYISTLLIHGLGKVTW